MTPPAQAPSDRERILLKLRERIVAFAASRLSRDVAEDLAQEVLMVLHDKYADVDRIEDLIPLSLQIARFKIVAYRRRSLRRGEPSQVSVDEMPLADIGPSPELLAANREIYERLLKAIAALGERCRQLLRLKLLGRSFAEIQEEMNAASINTVYTWDARCRKSLLERMGGSWEAER